MKSAPAITFEYRPSRWLAVAVAAVAVFALVALAASGIPWWAGLAGAIIACCYTIVSLRNFRHRFAGRAAWQEAGHWRIAAADGVEHIADLEDAVVRGPWIVLRLRRSDGGRIALILGPDNSDADLRRRLRVRLARV